MNNLRTHKKIMDMQLRNPKQLKRPFGFNVIGYVSRSFGLGVMSRNLVRLLLNKNYPVAIYDLNDPMVLQKQEDFFYEDYCVKTINKLPFSINLFTLPLSDAADLLFSDLSKLIKRRHCLNVFCHMWELTVLPTIWVKSLQLCDIIVTQSDFIRFSCENYLPTMPIISADHPLYLPDNIKPSRDRFGLPKGVVLFVYSYAPRSDTERKNPFAVLRAFKLAFKGSSRAHLVIKIDAISNNGGTHPSVEEIRRESEKDRRIHIITEDLTYPEILSLYASCDVFVSLHRSEGLGLALMEAMHLGKPVIATGWSGNMAFMSYRNSCPIRYKLIPARGILGVKLKNIGAFWADPDIEDAAQWMRRLAEDDNLRHSIGKKAAHDMANFQKIAKKGYFAEDIKAIWENRSP